MKDGKPQKGERIKMFATLYQTNSRDQYKGGERMKKVLVISMVMLFAVAMMASGATHDWVAFVTGVGATATAGTTIGMGYGATDALNNDLSETLGVVEPTAAYTPVSDTMVVISALGQYVDVRANDGTTKVWNLSAVGGGTGYTGTFAFKIAFANSAGYDIPNDLGGLASDYLPTGTGTFTLTNATTQAVVWTSAASALAGGRTVQTVSGLALGNYNLTYSEVQAPDVPEPGSMLALGSGLVGLMGFAIRRRK
jgi:hypothetical protein